MTHSAASSRCILMWLWKKQQVLNRLSQLAPLPGKRSGRSLAFGPQIWPHLLVRAMLAEQIYRALTILTGHPYHRA